jgi:hypothetical protein
MTRRRNEVRKGDIFENMEAHRSSSEKQGNLQKWVKKTEKPEKNGSLKGGSSVSSTEEYKVTVVSVMYICRLTLNRLRTYAICLCSRPRICGKA